MPVNNLTSDQLLQQVKTLQQQAEIQQQQSETQQQQAETQVKKFQNLIPKEPTSFVMQTPQTKIYNPAEDGGLWLSGMILGFSLVVIGVICYLLKSGSDSESLLKIFGTILIIVAAVFLIVAGYSEQQIAPVIGLLGTVAGYLLGTQHTRKKPDE